MNSKLIFVFILITLLKHSSAVFRKNLFPAHSPANPTQGDPGKPLFLTPYINSGKIEEARKLSQVQSLPNAPNVTSYSGLLTVNSKYNSNIFFWFFPALNNNKSAPVLVWLQGGPGGSSLFGLFVENGPFVVRRDLTVLMRGFSWTQNYSVIYIDNPVGTGFSFTDNDAGYATNETDVALDLYEALEQFFMIYYEYRSNDFYITGESYAGKYVPAIAYKIFTEGSHSNINLKGIAVGDGLCDPVTMFDYGDYLYQIGLIDELQRDFFSKEEEKAVQYIKDGKYFEAFKIFDLLLNGDLINTTSYFTNATGLTFYYNFLYTKAPDDFDYYIKYLGLDETRKAIHVGNLTYNDGNAVETHLLNDIMQSVKPWIEALLDNNYKVLMYSGQLDIIIAAPLTESFLNSMQWRYANEYKKAKRMIWKVSPQDIDVAGYVRNVHNFYQVIVRNGGHILPYDQPRSSLDMIQRFVSGNGFE